MPTIRRNISFSGVGIHSGEKVNMVIKPLGKKHEILFKRTDIPDEQQNLVTARYGNVCDTSMRNTTIGKRDGTNVKTIEHLMAAFFMAGIDSALIEIDGPEVPIMDGSAAEFYSKISKAGKTNGFLKQIVVRKTIEVRADSILKKLPWWKRNWVRLVNFFTGRKFDGFVRISPSDNIAMNITATLDYPNKVIGRQSYSYSFVPGSGSVADFVENIARARTFGRYGEWEKLKEMGMARGANENNVIVVNDKGDGTMNELYWPDEFVRHKIIDLIGDMFLSEGMIIANIESYKGSHALNTILLKKLFRNPNNYDIIYMQR